MNEIVPVQPDQNLVARNSGPSAALIIAVKDELAQKATRLARRLLDLVKEWDGRLKAKHEAEKAIRIGSGVIPVVRNSPSRDHLQYEIACGEAMLAEPMFQTLAADLAPFINTATVAQVKREIAKLLAAFPTKDDLTAFTALLMEEIVGEQPSWLTLAMACRQLRRNCRFRPSIMEVLEELAEADWHVRQSARIVRLPKYVAALKKHLAEAERLRPPEPTPLQKALTDCGCFVVCGADGSYYVVDGQKCFAGPFTTDAQAWPWLKKNAVALAAVS